MVQLRAVACGLPLVATTNTGGEDLHSDSVEGFIVGIRDPDALRERVLELYRDRDLREEMSCATLRRIQRLGGWETYGQRALDIYRPPRTESGREQYGTGALYGAKSRGGRSRLNSVGRTAIGGRSARVSLIAPLVALTSALLLGAALVTLNDRSGFPAASGGYDGPLVFALSLLFVFLAALPLVLGRTRDWFAVIYPVSVGYMLNFGFRGLYLAVHPEATLSMLPYWDALPMALGIAIVGFCLLLAGYYLPFGGVVARALPALPFRWRGEVSLAKVLVLYALGWIARALLFFTALPEAVHYYAIAFSHFCYYALAIAVACSFLSRCRRTTWRLVWVVMLLMELGYSVTWVRAKSPIILPLVIILLLRHYLSRRIGGRELALAACLIVLVVFPIISAYRSIPGVFAVRSGAGDSAQSVDAASGLSRAFANVSALDPQGYADLATVSIMQRSMLLDSLALVLKYTPVIGGFLGPWDYILVPAYAFVPRVVWNDKPTDVAAYFGRDFGLSDWNYVGIGNPGDLYRHLGLPGVVAGMFVLGLVYRVLYEFFVVSRSREDWETRLPHLCFYALILAQVYLSLETDLGTGWSELLKQLLFLSVVAWFMQPHTASLKRERLVRKSG